MESKRRDGPKEQKEKKYELKSHRVFKEPKQDGRLTSDGGREAFFTPTLFIPSAESGCDITFHRLAIPRIKSRKYSEAIMLLSVITTDCDQDDLNVCLAHYYLSLCYSGVGKFSLARQRVDQAIEMLDRLKLKAQVDIHRMKSSCFNQKAIIHYHISKQYLVDSDIENHNKERIIATQYLQQSIEELSADFNAHNSYELFQKTQKEFDEDKVPEVKEQFQCDFSSLNLHYASAYPAVGPLYINEGNAEKAIEYFNKAIANQQIMERIIIIVALLIKP